VGFDSPYPIYYFSFNLPYKFHSWIPAFAGMTTIFHVWLDRLLDLDYCGNDNYLATLEKPFCHPGLDPGSRIYFKLNRREYKNHGNDIAENERENGRSWIPTYAGMTSLLQVCKR